MSLLSRGWNSLPGACSDLDLISFLKITSLPFYIVMHFVKNHWILKVMIIQQILKTSKSGTIQRSDQVPRFFWSFSLNSDFQTSNSLRRESYFRSIPINSWSFQLVYSSIIILVTPLNTNRLHLNILDRAGKITAWVQCKTWCSKAVFCLGIFQSTQSGSWSLPLQECLARPVTHHSLWCHSLPKVGKGAHFDWCGYHRVGQKFN